jgi:hypothetical protein
MRIVFELDTLKPMIDAIERIASGESPMYLLEMTLNRPEYQMEFDRITPEITKKDFIEFLYGFFSEPVDQWSRSLQFRVPAYLDLIQNIPLYRRYLEQLDHITDATPMQEITRLLRNGLPEELADKELRVAIKLGVGPGNGFLEDDMAHLDFLNLVQSDALNVFPSGLAHEIHHLLFAELTPKHPSLEELLYLYFAGEGLAAKYCHNASGTMSRPLDAGMPTMVYDPKSWKRWNKRFNQGFEILRRLREDIQSGAIARVEDLHQAIVSQFFQSSKFKHNQLETLGNDLFGVIHDTAGKEMVYRIIGNPSLFPNRFNEAMKQLGHSKYSL